MRDGLDEGSATGQQGFCIGLVDLDDQAFKVGVARFNLPEEALGFLLGTWSLPPHQDGIKGFLIHFDALDQTLPMVKGFSQSHGILELGGGWMFIGLKDRPMGERLGNGDS